MVITGQTRNLLVGTAGSGVRIPPSPFLSFRWDRELFCWIKALFGAFLMIGNASVQVLYISTKNTDCIDFSCYTLADLPAVMLL